MSLCNICNLFNNYGGSGSAQYCKCSVVANQSLEGSAMSFVALLLLHFLNQSSGFRSPAEGFEVCPAAQAFLARA